MAFKKTKAATSSRLSKDGRDHKHVWAKHDGEGVRCTLCHAKSRTETQHPTQA